MLHARLDDLLGLHRSCLVVWKQSGPSMLLVDQPDLKICRMQSNTFIKHVLALYSIDQMLEFFERAKLRVMHDAQGLDGRGL